MSSGAAGIVGTALKIPVAREVVLAIAWYVSICLCVEDARWLLMSQIIVAGLLTVAGYWWFYNRRREKGGGGAKVLWLVILVLAAIPILLVAAKRRRGRSAHGVR